VGEIDFFPKGHVPPTHWPGDNQFNVNYEVDRYQDVIGTLRNEKFVYVTIFREQLLPGSEGVSAFVESSRYGPLPTHGPLNPEVAADKYKKEMEEGNLDNNLR
jgi:hypothetical protein